MKMHWRDIAIMVIGAWLVISPGVLGLTLAHAFAYNAYGVGIGIIVFNLISAWRLEDLGNEIVNIVLGAWLVLAPFAFGFADTFAATLNDVAAGVAIAALAVWDLVSSAGSNSPK